MSLASSLRSHFCKRLKLYGCVPNFISINRGIHCLVPPSHLAKAAQAEQQQFPRQRRRLTLAFYNDGGGTTVDDSFSAPYLSVRLSCPSHCSDALGESLICFGATSTTIDDQDSSEEIWITCTFKVDQNVRDCISRAANSVGLNEIPNFKVEMHDHTDWIKQSQESFHPVEIAEGLWIVPEWKEPPDVEAVNIILNPGLAFGTGEHPTTKLCLLLLLRLIKGGESFLDYGTGSGVLAIAAVKLGADVAVGFDIEPQAIRSARHNGALNNIGAEKLVLSLVESEECPASATDLYNPKMIAQIGKYDVVIANILLNPVLELADRIVSYAKPGAVIGISGIISDQVPAVVERYSELLEDLNVSMMDDWACISGSRKAEPTSIQALSSAR